MVTVLTPENFVHLLHCPQDSQHKLVIENGEAVCVHCQKAYPIRDDGVLDLVEMPALDTHTASELTEHTTPFDPEKMRQTARYEQQAHTSYYSRMRMPPTRTLDKYLRQLNTEQLIFLGVGSGREIMYLRQLRDLHTLYCSDLAYAEVRRVPYRLEDSDIKVGLFTADLAHMPLTQQAIPVIIMGAIHHTPDMYATLERLLQKGHTDIIFSEPITNGLLQSFKKLGLAQRKEYSGVRPGRFELSKMVELCRQYHYHPTITTEWDFPRDYYYKLTHKIGLYKNNTLLDLFFGSLNIFSKLTNLFNFGNRAVVHLHYHG